MRKKQVEALLRNVNSKVIREGYEQVCATLDKIVDARLQQWDKLERRQDRLEKEFVSLRRFVTNVLGEGGVDDDS